MTLEELKGKKFPVLDKGHVILLDVMGDDQAIVDAARTSYQKGTKTPSDNETLIRSLMRHRHSTPFEMAELKFHIRIPMDAWRQWIRHRTANVNEYSTRYSVAIDDKQETKSDAWRAQNANSKQGSDGLVTDWPEAWRTSDPTEMHPPHGPISLTRSAIAGVGQYLTARENQLHGLAEEVYKERLDAGVAREQARKDLPLSTYTEAIWKIDLHNLLHFLGLRMEPAAQLEIREYATIMGTQIVAPLFPMVWKAFEDYRLNAVTLSAVDIEFTTELARRGMSLPVGNVLASGVMKEMFSGRFSVREQVETIKKLTKIGFIGE